MTLGVTLVSLINRFEGDRLRNMHLRTKSKHHIRIHYTSLRGKIQGHVLSPATYKRRRRGILNSKWLNKAGIRRTRERESLQGNSLL